MATEKLYVGHDNSINRILKTQTPPADPVAVDLTNATKIALTIGTETFESTDAANGIITWAQGGYDTGEIRIKIGNEAALAALAGSTYDAEITVFDSANLNGITWDTVRIEVIAEYYT